MRMENWQCIWSGETEQKKYDESGLPENDRKGRGVGNWLCTTLPRRYTTERREIEQ